MLPLCNKTLEYNEPPSLGRLKLALFAFLRSFVTALSFIALFFYSVSYFKHTNIFTAYLAILVKTLFI